MKNYFRQLWEKLGIFVIVPKSTRLKVYKRMLQQMQNIPIMDLDGVELDVQGFPADYNIYNQFSKCQINFCTILSGEEESWICYYPELMASTPYTCWKHNPAYWWHPHDRVRLVILQKIINKMEISFWDILLQR